MILINPVRGSPQGSRCFSLDVFEEEYNQSDRTERLNWTELNISVSFFPVPSADLLTQLQQGQVKQRMDLLGWWQLGDALTKVWEPSPKVHTAQMSGKRYQWFQSCGAVERGREWGASTGEPARMLRGPVRRLTMLAPGFGTEHSWICTFLSCRIPVPSRCFRVSCLTTMWVSFLLLQALALLWRITQELPPGRRGSLHGQLEDNHQPVANRLRWNNPPPSGKQGCVNFSSESSTLWVKFRLAFIQGSILSSIFPLPVPCHLLASCVSQTTLSP